MGEKILIAIGRHGYPDSASSKIYRSVDGGISWSVVASGLPTMNKIIYAGNGLIYVCAGYAFNRGYIYKSTDYGENWSLLISFTDAIYGVHDLAINPNNPDHLIAFPDGSYSLGTEGKVYTSLNGGSSWSLSSRIFDNGDVSNESGWCVGVLSNGNLLVQPLASSQYKYDWSVWSVFGTNPGHGITVVDDAIIMSPRYGAFSNNYIYRSTNGGSSYLSIGRASGDTTSTGSYFICKVNDVIYVTMAGSLFLYRSTNSGVSFTKVNNISVTISKIVQYDGDTLFAAAWDGKIKKSIDNGLTWSNSYSSDQSAIKDIICVEKPQQTWESDPVTLGASDAFPYIGQKASVKIASVRNDSVSGLYENLPTLSGKSVEGSFRRYFASIDMERFLTWALGSEDELIPSRKVATLGFRKGPSDYIYESCICTGFTVRANVNEIVTVDFDYISKSELRLNSGQGGVTKRKFQIAAFRSLGSDGSGEWSFPEGVEDFNTVFDFTKSSVWLGTVPNTLTQYGVTNWSVSAKIPVNITQDSLSGLLIREPILEKRIDISGELTISRHSISLWEDLRDSHSTVYGNIELGDDTLIDLGAIKLTQAIISDDSVSKVPLKFVGNSLGITINN